MGNSILGILLVITLTCCTSCKDEKVITKENAKKGEVLFNSTGCTLCHSVSGEARYGPPLNFMYGKDVIVIRKGRELSIKLDRKYIIRSMKDPEYEKLKGYQNKKMSKINLSPEDIDYIADFLIYINPGSSKTRTGK